MRPLVALPAAAVLLCAVVQPAQAVPPHIFQSMGLQMSELGQLCSIVDKLLANTGPAGCDSE